MLHAVYLILVNELRMASKLKIPLLLILAVIIILIMLRLAVWQLGRAEQKQQILDQVSMRAEKDSMPLLELLKGSEVNKLKYRRVSISGFYKHEKSIYVDNQVLSGQVGYRVFTPFELGDGEFVMVNRGWIPAGESRAQLPKFTTSQMQLTLLPLVVELAPEQIPEADERPSTHDDSQFTIAWLDINDEWVAKHKGYAFQWLMMAVAFFIACLVLLIRYSMKKDD